MRTVYYVIIVKYDIKPVVMSIEVRYGGLFLRFRGVLDGDSGVIFVEMALGWHCFWHSAALRGDTILALNGTYFDTVVIVMYN